MREPTLDPAPESAHERGLQRLAALARDAGSRDVPDAWRPRVLAAIDRSTALEAARLWPWFPAAGASRARPLVMVAASALVVLAIAGAIFFFRPEAPLAYSVTSVTSFASGSAQPMGDPSLASSYVRGGPDGAVARFGDGTVIGFAPGARGRVVAVTARGARVNVDQGKAHFRVVHRPRAEWTVEAGPFTIAVTGTEFDVIWRDEQLDLVMQSGSVSVRGPLTPQGIVLRGGQHLAADIARGELTIAASPGVTGAAAPTPPESSAPPSPWGRPEPSPARLTAADPLSPSSTPDLGARSATEPPPPSPPSPIASGEAPDTLNPALPPPQPPLESAPGRPDGSVPGSPSLSERSARGDFAGVIAEAEARGIDVVLGTGSLADVSAVADAARYTKKNDLARRAMLIERSRFAGSAEARSAAFLLGRMAEVGSPAAAVGWYDTYLAESPQGALAPEALGRKMVAVKASSNAAAARPVAAEYLRRYPRGAFAEAAGEILAGPDPQTPGPAGR